MSDFDFDEQKYKKILEDFFTGVFTIKNLLSHGIDHHKRVWIYAKEILDLLEKENLMTNRSLPAKLIISCYLHDSGMTVDPGARHGKHSRSLCEEFLHIHNLSQIENADVLSAIENHDNKDYSQSGHPADLLTILSVADDLDAFGFIGIYRYLEIYLTRGYSLKETGYLIKENAGKRFDNLIKTYGFMDIFIEKQRKRYEILDSFFNDFNQEASHYAFKGKNPTGYCGVAEIIQYMLINKLNMNEIYFHIKNDYDDPIIKYYFGSFTLELNEYNF
jgi:HD superfamily phosphodiesterase